MLLATAASPSAMCLTDDVYCRQTSEIVAPKKTIHHFLPDVRWARKTGRCDRGPQGKGVVKLSRALKPATFVN